ncbi:MAG TPA: hypothetical protein VFI65_01455 [Streptosporangiaceae bacterium]|nr:hypothetical protein [Streptosporangiaceae bacterium]
MDTQFDALVLRKRLRVPLPASAAGPASAAHEAGPVNEAGAVGGGGGAARQLDSVLLSAGFKLSGELMHRLSGLPTGEVLDLGTRVLAGVRELVGDHVQHNAYFKEFPDGVPDTMEFWISSLRAALLDPVAAENLEAGFVWLPDGDDRASEPEDNHAAPLDPTPTAKDDSDQPAEGGKLVLGWLNLLSLPNYGRYQHTYEEMLAAHEELGPAVTDRVTVLHAGGTLGEETSALYLSLAGSTVPLSEEDLAALGDLALFCATGPQPEKIPVRENRAVINRVRLHARKPLIVDTVTDVLRLACAASDGDVTLETPTRFRSFGRPERRLLLAALDEIVAASPGKLGDVAARREAWKRLGERLHPHEYPQWPHAQDVFAVSRGEKRSPSFDSMVESTMATSGAGAAARLLTNAPGRLWRSIDRLLRESGGPAETDAIVRMAAEAAPGVSGRVLLSVREHLVNRQIPTDVSRVFTNRKGRAWTGRENRPPLIEPTVSALMAVIDAEVSRRLPDYGTILIDPSILGVALPLSGKAVAPGFGMMPRGSVCPVDGELLRFFVYWKQRSNRTDYDLSALLLADNFLFGDQVSWTNYNAGEGKGYAVYSGDLTQAPDGASEFIDVSLPNTPRKIIIPQVNIYSGEAFDRAQEAFFGFMIRSEWQKGAPFEARTVRMKSDLRGAGQVALPLAFLRGDDGRWRAKWLHLYLKGRPNFNTVTNNRATASLLTRAIVQRDYLCIGDLMDLISKRGGQVKRFDGTLPAEPVTFIGLERPDGLADGSQVITLQNLAELIPG